METVFTIIFGVGVGYSALAFILGEALGSGDYGGGGALPIQPSVIAAFVTVFGGTGLILARFMPPLTAIPLAGLLGAAIAFGFYRLIVLPLTKAQNTTAIEVQSLIGHMAKVAEKIPQGQYGKITYKVNDSTYHAPAKSEDGNEIARYTSVEIVYIEKNTYYVRPI
ncbi:MAG: hypothetical protein FWC91_10105 [Defluviitaleaceae bacterium]|nr:hypothetical protein [Defluviitaleaceae bacterium]